MADTSGVLARLQAALSVYDPSWDVSVGTATYKILEAVAQEIAYANNNSILQTYSYDINTKSGSELDAFVNLFGLYRQLGQRATGSVTFSTNTPATNILDIPIGTQVAVPVGGNYTNTTAIIYSTTAPAIIAVGETTALVPITAVLPGTTGNVPVNTIVTILSTLNGITSVINNAAITGGLDPESDLALQNRWTSTAFNNNSGTQGKYTITALQDPNVTLVNAVGQQSFYSEQLQINTNLGVTTTNTGSITLSLVAYSGMTVNNITYSGTTTVTGYNFGYLTTPSAMATELNTLISGIYPSIVNSSGFVYSVSGVNGATNFASAGVFNISTNLPSPYRLVASGTSSASGVTTTGNYYFYDYIVSNNPDVGYSGTLSYNNNVSVGSIFPQGNELLGSNLNTYNQTTYANLTDYYYPTNPTPQLTINIVNSSNEPSLFIGNTPQLISEYNSSSSRSITLTSGNYVDIFINGTSPSIASEQIVFNPNFVLSPGSSTKYLNSNNYIFANGSQAGSTVSGHYYLPLNAQPAINIPSQLSTSSNGTADTIFLYDTTVSSGTLYPIANNFYPQTVFTVDSSVTSGSYFLPISGTTGSGIYPGMILAGGNAVISNSLYYVASVSSSGVTLNQPTTGNVAITITGVTAFYPLYDNTNTQNSILSMTALALNPGSSLFSNWPAIPTAVGWANYGHQYNNDVVTVESLVQQSRPFGSNTLVHQASFINLTINIRLVLSNGYSIPSVQSSIYNQLSIYLQNVSYLGTISFATVAAQILSTTGVANVRVTSIKTNALDGTILNTYTKDFILASNQLPSLYNINYTVVGASNF